MYNSISILFHTLEKSSGSRIRSCPNSVLLGHDHSWHFPKAQKLPSILKHKATFLPAFQGSRTCYQLFSGEAGLSKQLTH
jgi:hypothetical protein